MARIPSSAPDKIVAIKQFRGLNENQGGDTKLALGEASICRNWKVTRDGNLQRRPGQVLVGTLSAGNPVKCLWHGWLNGYEYLLAACDNKLYIVYDGATNTYPCTAVTGSIDTSDTVSIFGFDEKAYILDGTKYRVFDGVSIADVDADPYVPLIANAIGPTGTAEAAGTLLEQVNKLTPKRRVWLSPDGTNSAFKLPEDDITSIISVKKLSDLSDLAYTRSGSTITFTTVPAVGTNSIEVVYQVGTGFAGQVNAMKYAELYSGASDNRIFLYGDGTNELFYSDIDYDGKPRADYFPDMNEVAVGDSNTPVTGVIRHQSRLICYKLDSTWSISASTLSLADGSLIPSFYVQPVNRIIGNEAVGQVQLVLNTPRTLFHNELYDWRSNQAYTGNITNDERQAKRISDRIYSTLRLYRITECVCYDDNPNQEYYIAYNGEALVHNYAIDAWYTYSNFNAVSFGSLFNELYFGTPDGEVRKLSPLAKNDYDHHDSDENKDVFVPIEAYWESGAMDFGADYMRKYSSVLWISMKPESGSYTEIYVITNNRSDLATRTAGYGLSGFATLDFNSFTFTDDTQPQITRLRIKAKKFVYYRLIFENSKADTNATILGADIKMRQTGYAK